MTSIKILHIIKSLGRGGAEMLLPETLKLHDQEKFEFHYMYFLPWKNQMVGSILQAGGKVTCLSAKNNIQLMLKAREVARYIREHQIQLIHAHLPWAGILARIVGKMTGVPVIYTEHNKQERYHFVTRYMNLMTMNWATGVIAVSEDVEKSISRYKPKLKPFLQTILNGVNTDHFSFQKLDDEAVKYSLGIPINAPVIGTIAVFRFQKRLDLWMELAAKIIHRVPEVHFILVGDGPLKEMLLEKRKNLKLVNKIHMVGLQTEVRPYLAAFDLYMMTSVFEGLPIALLEAMASGCTVISTDAGGIKEVITHEKEGLLCAVEAPDRLVNFAVALMNDPEKCQRLGLLGRKRVEESFSMKRMVGELEKVYTSTVQE